MSAEPALSKVDPGRGPQFEVADFPEPPRDLNFRKLMAILGPAVIALGGTIGGGEWLVGPSLFVKWGLALLWITTVSSLLQVYLNLEMCRYTLYTGEPITVGFMRLAPGKAFWGWFFTVIGFLERALPGWALGTATAVAALQLGKIPGAADRSTVVFWGYLVFASCCLIICLGKTIERTLEWANWIMMIVVLGGLFLLDLYIVPASVWWEGITGFVTFGYIPKGVDMLLLAPWSGTRPTAASAITPSATGTVTRATGWAETSATSPRPSAARKSMSPTSARSRPTRRRTRSAGRAGGSS